MNQAIIAGNVGADPKPLGDKGVSLRIATTEYSKDDQKKTEWHDVVAFGYAADTARTLRKGDAVMAIGRLETRKVQKQDGSTGYYTSVIASRLYPSPKPETTPAAQDEHEDLGF